MIGVGTHFIVWVMVSCHVVFLIVVEHWCNYCLFFWHTLCWR